MSDGGVSAQSVRKLFHESFGCTPQVVVRAPGRVNLIGEHTDYNDGYVLPMAINRWVWMAASPRPGTQMRGASVQFEGMAEVDDFTASANRGWIRYPAAVSKILSNSRDLGGMDIAVDSDIPVASGLSSSAALEVATCLALESVFGFTLTALERTQTALRAEQSIIGLKCGMMDMFASSHGMADHALLLDTQSGKWHPVPMQSKEVNVLIADTGVARNLTEVNYNARQAECMRAVRLLQLRKQELRSLRGLTKSEFDEIGFLLPDILFRRVRHVLSENARTLEAATTLKSGDWTRMGQLMRESHASLRDDYEVSCTELDILADAQNAQPGVYGARMTGAGFGGCTVALVSPDAVDSVQKAVSESYQNRIGRNPSWCVCTPAAGAERVE